MRAAANTTIETKTGCRSSNVRFAAVAGALSMNARVQPRRTPRARTIGSTNKLAGARGRGLRDRAPEEDDRTRAIYWTIDRESLQGAAGDRSARLPDPRRQAPAARARVRFLVHAQVALRSGVAQSRDAGIRVGGLGVSAQGSLA